MNEILVAFIPIRAISKSTLKLIIGVQIAIFFLIWAFYPFVLLPSIRDTWAAFTEQWQQGLGAELLTSVWANMQAIGIAAFISLGLSYLTVLAGFRPVVAFLSKLRFLSMIGLSFMFTVMTSSQHQLKISMLVFSISVFFITGMMDVIASIPKEQYDLARTLRMGPWRVVWEVVVLGQADRMMDTIRQNSAISWMMLSMIEGMVRSEGGIGAMLMTANKHFYLNAVVAIQITVFLVGIGQDYVLGVCKNLACPYAELALEKK